MSNRKAGWDELYREPAPDLAAKLAKLEAENERLRELVGEDAILLASAARTLRAQVGRLEAELDVERRKPYRRSIHGLQKMPGMDGRSYYESTTTESEIHHLHGQIESIRASRAELLAALKRLVSWVHTARDITSVPYPQDCASAMKQSLAAKTLEAEEAAKYDMRKAGAPALQIALETRFENLPTPAANDKGKWEQYTALCEKQTDERGNVVAVKETPAAARFKASYLTRK